MIFGSASKRGEEAEGKEFSQESFDNAVVDTTDGRKTWKEVKPAKRPLRRPAAPEVVNAPASTKRPAPGPSCFRVGGCGARAVSARVTWDDDAERTDSFQKPPTTLRAGLWTTRAEEMENTRLAMAGTLVDYHASCSATKGARFLDKELYTFGTDDV